MINFKDLSDWKSIHWDWINNRWDKLETSSIKDVGYMMDFCYEHNPRNIEHLHQLYTSIDANKRVYDSIVKSIETDTGFNNDMANILATICLFYNTFMGYQAEQEFKKIVESKFPKINFKKTPPDMDNKYAVDFIWKLGNKKGAVQIKSAKSKRENSTGYLNRNDSKNYQFTQDYKIPVEYIYYNSKYNPNTYDFKISFN